MAGTGRVSRQWISPSIGGGLGSVAARGMGVPTLVSPVIPNATRYFEDFIATSIAEYRFRDSTGVVLSSYGNPAWQYSKLGTLTSAQCGLDSDSDKYGNLRILTGTAADGGILFGTGSQNILGSANNHLTFGSASYSSIGQWRATTSGGTTGFAWALGWLFQLDNTVDWITDPTTVLLAGGTTGIIFHRTTVAANALGGVGNVNNVMCGFFDTGVLTGTPITCVTAPVSGVYHKYELGWSHSTGLFTVYVDGASVGTQAATGTLIGVGTQAFGGVRNSAANSRQFWIDSYFQEMGAATPR